jgi:predicted MFS family arabinose efflux permease
MILLVVGFPILALVKTPFGYHLAGGVLGLGYGVIMPTFHTMINNITPHNRRGAANASFFTAFDLGIGLGMIGTGMLSQWLGFSSTFLVSSVINLVALNLFAFSTIRHYNGSMNEREKFM